MTADDVTLAEAECVCPTDDYCPRCHPRWYAIWRAKQAEVKDAREAKAGVERVERCRHGEPESGCPSCAACAACRGECGVCPYARAALTRGGEQP